MRRFKKLGTYVFSLVVAATVLTACTSKELYNATQQNREENCRSMPQQEAELCLARLNKKSYDEYEDERRKLIKNK